MRRALLLTIVLAVAVGAASVALLGGDEQRQTRISFSTSAPVTDGEAYVKEAIDNLRGAERFTFTQTVARAANPGDPGAGEVTGAVDLASSANDQPKMKTKVGFKRSDNNAPVAAEQVAVGEELWVKNPGRPSFNKSDKKPHKARGKKQGRTEEVDVIDPVMLVLEPLDSLGGEAFGTPSNPDDAGRRTVVVTLPGGGTVRVLVDDADRVVTGYVYERDGSSVSVSLSDIGGPVEVSLD